MYICVIYLSIHLWSIYPNIYLIYLSKSIYHLLSIYHLSSINLSIIDLSIYLSSIYHHHHHYLSIYLSIYYYYYYYISPFSVAVVKRHEQSQRRQSLFWLMVSEGLKSTMAGRDGNRNRKLRYPQAQVWKTANMQVGQRYELSNPTSHDMHPAATYPTVAPTEDQILNAWAKGGPFSFKSL